MTDRVDASRYVVTHTQIHTMIGWGILLIVVPIGALTVLLASHGLAIIIFPIWWALRGQRMRKLQAMLRGSGVRVDATQFPEIYESARAMSVRLGMAECPEIYIMESNSQNALALKHGPKRYIILIDDIVFGAQATGNPRVLDFILGHELAHHALGHTGYWRGLMSTLNTTLGRLDELSCDAVGYVLTGDLQTARDSLCLLLVGPQLFPRLNRDAIEKQAQETLRDSYTKKAEEAGTYPLLLHRYARLAMVRP